MSAVVRVVVVALVLGACSDGGASTSTSTAPSTAPTSSSSSSTASWPRVDLVDDAVTALETELGAPQEYFEINATARLVNLFVALNDSELVQPWVFLDGELTSTEGQEATGSSFTTEAIDFDPDTVLSHVQTELPQSNPDVFFIEGGEGGIVRYSVAVTSRQGGQLVVVVAGDGRVLSVET